MTFKQRGVGGRSSPQFARTTIFLYFNHKHGDDMTVFLLQADMVLKQRRWRGAQHPPFANKMIRTIFFSYTDGDDMMFFYWEHGWPKRLQE